jgi:hypothetical protein
MFQNHDQVIVEKRNNTVKKNMTEIKELRAEPVASFTAEWISGPTGLVVISLLKITGFQDVATFSLVGEYRSFGRICFLQLQVYSYLAYIP